MVWRGAKLAFVDRHRSLAIGASPCRPRHWDERGDAAIQGVRVISTATDATGSPVDSWIVSLRSQ
ncbi:hypothetical protein EB810_11850 [Altererythrobacter sp. FM1]|nr:hypothetical protein EB810_11850 [Altererythrobacter sp. FM1]